TPALVELWSTELDQRQQRPNESVDQYTSSVQELYQRINDRAFAYPDNIQARKFISGLLLELYVAVKPFGDQTLQAAIDRARACELTLREGKSKPSNYVTIQSETTDGAARSIVSCWLLNDLGIAIDRPSMTLMINVNGERRRPLGEVLNFPVTIKGMVIPINVVVTDAMDYSAIVRNDWLTKVKANIDYEISNMIIHWEGNEIEVPVEYLEMPMKRRKKREEQIRKEEEKDESEVGEEENDEEENEEEESEYEEYEEENLDEKVFCHYRMKRKTRNISKQNTSLQLTCQFPDIVIAGVYPKENFVLTKEGVGLDESFYHWDYFSRLDEQFKRKAPRKTTWDYDWKGLSARCWCGNRLYSPSDECPQCLRELTNYITVQRLGACQKSADFSQL
ncbi:hypothetical protein RhiirA4_481663, partial [Rhizophagus irregularis]